MSATKVPKYDFFHPGLLDFVAQSSAAATAWVAAYRQSGAIQIERRITRAFKAMRSGDLGAGGCLLDEIENEQLPSLSATATDPAIPMIAHRWFHSVEAFRQYRNGNNEAAAEHLFRAEQAIQSAIDRWDFLKPFAHHCTDFRFQRARLARQVQSWLTMRDHLESVRAMNQGTVPLCVLSDGQPVLIHDLRQFYHSLTLTPEHQHSLRSLLDSELCLAMTEQAIRRFYARLSPVIIY